MAIHDQLPSFFRQRGLGPADWQECLFFLDERFPEHAADQKIEQGGCSYTVKLILQRSNEHGDNRLNQDIPFIVQFRPAWFALSLAIADAAKRWYGDLAPSVSEIGRLVAREDGPQMIVYRMTCIPGVRFDEVQPRAKTLGPDMLLKTRNLLDDLADFYARAWKIGMRDSIDHGRRRCDGNVGSSVQWRLRKLESDLPSAALRSTATTAKDAVDAGGLDRLPIVLTHGDLLPSNILVDERTWHMNGLIDWTESEYLPFGLSLYGLEHLLGWTSDCRFTHFAEAGSLWKYFWQRLGDKIPELEQRENREAVELGRVVGILLWHGFAWDDGRIDRVVEPVRDAEELEYLDAFLGTGVPGSAAHL